MTMEDATQAREATEDGIQIALSDVAAREVRKFVEEESVDADVAGLRVAVVPGGCSGFEYSLTLEDQVEEDDFVVESHGIKLFVDPFSAQYLTGTRIGYTSGFQGSGFTFDNPNASGGCGCGSSFAV